MLAPTPSWFPIDELNDHPFEFSRAPSTTLAVRDGHGALFIASSEHGLTRAPLPPLRHVIDALFTTRDFGVALVEPGVCFQTTDGGRQFARVDLGAATAIALRAAGPSDPAAIRITTTERDWLIGPAAAPIAVAHEDPPAQSAVAEPPPDTELGDRFLPRDSAYTRLIALQNGRGLLADGRAVASPAWDRSLELVEVNGASNRFSMTATCRLVASGTELLAWCGGENPELRRYTNDGSWVSIRAFPGARGAAIDAEGGSIVVDAPCGPEHRIAGGRAPLCWYHAGLWGPFDIDAALTIEDVRGGDVLLRPRDRRRQSWWPQWLAFHDRGPSLEGIPVVGDGIHAWARFDATGPLLSVIRYAEGRATTLLRGVPGGQLREVPIPGGTRSAHFVDAVRGLAMGDGLFFTLDAGAHWQSMPLQVDGDDSPLRTWGPHVRCRREYCSAGRIVWASSQALGSARPRVIGATRAPPQRVIDRQSFHLWNAEYSEARQWACPVGDQGMPEPTTEGCFGDGAWIDVHPRGAARGGAGEFAISWTGADPVGRFRARSLLSALPAVGRLEGAARIWIHLRLATRRVAVFERCRFGDATTCEVVFARANAIARSLGSMDSIAGFEAPDDRRSVAVSLGNDGPFGLWLPSHDTLLILSDAGEITARRRFVWSPSFTATFLAVTPQGVGIAIAARPDSTLRWFPMDPAREPVAIGVLPPDHPAHEEGKALRHERAAENLVETLLLHCPTHATLDAPYLDVEVHAGVAAREVANKVMPSIVPAKVNLAADAAHRSPRPAFECHDAGEGVAEDAPHRTAHAESRQSIAVGEVSDAAGSTHDCDVPGFRAARPLGKGRQIACETRVTPQRSPTQCLEDPLNWQPIAQGHHREVPLVGQSARAMMKELILERRRGSLFG